MKKIFCLTILAVLCTFGVASAQQFPSVQIETQDGKTIDTKTLIDGKTPVIISFWSTTCKPCIKELDAISFKRALNVNVTPHVFIFDKDGKMVYSHTSYLPGGEMELIQKIKTLQ